MCRSRVLIASRPSSDPIRAATARQDQALDYEPVVKIFTPDGNATWLLTELGSIWPLASATRNSATCACTSSSPRTTLTAKACSLTPHRIHIVRADPATIAGCQ